MLVEIRKLTFGIKSVDAQSHLAIVKVRVVQAQNIILAARTNSEVASNSLSFSHKILLRNIGTKNKAIAAAVSTPYLKCARGTFLHIDQ